GKGYAYEALQAIFPYAFNYLKLRQINAIVETKNAASIALCQKLGFGLLHTRQQAEFKDGHSISLHTFGLLNTNAASL
ncbi:MAG TPA: GNAT family protein, partial [Phnomibacter sp.]|nr:GNAT family protein [Phnomibacter sp.]